jgi:hypothetical protein
MAFHIQEPVPNWLESVNRLPNGALVKAFSVQWLSEAVAVNPGVKTLLRYHNDDIQHVSPSDTEAVRESRARDWFNRFIDDTFLNGQTAGIPHNGAVDYISWWNEYYAESQHPNEKELWWRQERTAARIWNDEYRLQYGGKLSHIRLAICATAVGNDIPWQSAQTALLYNAILDYHPYTYWARVGDEYVRGANDWVDLSGRWERMDSDFRSRGYNCEWLFGEAGPFESAVTGWRSDECLGGSVDRYLHAIKEWITDVKKTRAYKDGRVIGFNLFTTGGGSQWVGFETRPPEMNAIADLVAAEWTGAGSPPPPPPPPSSNRVSVTAAILNVRRVPTTAGNVPITTVRQGTILDVEERNGDWLKVTAWVHGNFTKDI